MTRRRQAVPLADARRFTGLIRRTRMLRYLLAAGLLALLAGVLVAAMGLREERRFLPAGTSGVVVLDVSASITSDTYRRIQATVAELAASRDHYGLVVFSDVAYEALPPGTPADELAPLVRWFEPRADRGGESRLPLNPWSNAIAGGTSISSGLAAAHRALRRDGIENGSVLLVSDLDDDPTDLSRLNREVDALRRTDTELRVIGLDPSVEDRRLFARLAPESLVADAEVAPEGLEEPRAIIGADVPDGLVIGAAALLLLLVVNEYWCGLLTWKTGRVGKGAT